MELFRNRLICKRAAIRRIERQAMNVKTFFVLHNFSRYYGLRRASPELSLSTSDGRICVFLLFHPGVLQSSIAATLLIDPSTVGKALLRLEHSGLIKRSIYPQNRRERIVELTKKGKLQYAELTDIQREWTEKVSAYLTEEENEEFDQLCGKLAAGAEEIYRDIQK